MAEYRIPDELRYTEEDEWARIEDGRVRVGITDYAQQQLGDVVFVELPETGTRVERSQPFGVIESVKAVSDLYAPVSGAVVEVNPELDEHPERVNESCYEEGWMIVIEASDPSELEQLLDADAYRRHVAERSEE